MHDPIIKELAAIVGPSHILTSPEDCWTYAYDATDQAHALEAAALPLVGSAKSGENQFFSKDLCYYTFNE